MPTAGLKSLIYLVFFFCKLIKKCFIHLKSQLYILLELNQKASKQIHRKWNNCSPSVHITSLHRRPHSSVCCRGCKERNNTLKMSVPTRSLIMMHWQNNNYVFDTNYYQGIILIACCHDVHLLR